MSTDQLSHALRNLVADVERGAKGPDAAELWGAGRRRRVGTVVLPAVVAACVAAVVAAVVWPSGVPQAVVPAERSGDVGASRLTAYPKTIAKPPFTQVTRAPSVTAALVPSGGSDRPPYAVSPEGEVTRVALPHSAFGLPDQAPSLSPDGRWVARGVVLTDLVRGETTPSEAEQTRLDRRWTPPQEPSWWSPDSRRVFVAAVNQGALRSDGVVVGVDGTTTEVPLVEGGLQATFAGWLDDDTLLALLDLGEGLTRLEVRTWSMGDPSWTSDDVVLSWSRDDSAELRALLSPDGSRLLLTAANIDAETNELARTWAMLFDPRSGARLGMPLTDGSLDVSKWAEGSAAGWEGWGCRPAWHDGLPIMTDRGVRGFVNPSGREGDDELVSVSSRYDQPCVAFAGNELRGTPVGNPALVWKERLWAWGLPVLGVTLAGLALWAWNRRHRGAWRQPPKRRPMIITQPF
ncbi:hypothetical protein N798_11150 [Knoellia flava TL1]|uniref:Uncharacterized protein n=2 Tax=Knoellia flava TaxID=913969 RepID=A0A8H9FV37_9MICO|nr:hypothetical protein [Knoellia flava]KGN30251.1 hypothetical protein N798_11150 [Knoellia flava TL1]GGB84620.1 hypothetical protein GCM10011314_25340 [Knoellia flava]